MARNVVIKVLVTPDEQAAIEALAKERGLSVSSLLRDSVLSDGSDNRTIETLAELITIHSRILAEFEAAGIGESLLRQVQAARTELFQALKRIPTP
jgi:hypothetical protein